MNTTTSDPYLEFLERYCRDDIVQLAQSDEERLVIDHGELFAYDRELAERFLQKPRDELRKFRNAVSDVDIAAESPEVKVGVGSIKPDKSVPELRHTDLGSYIGVRGRVQEVTQVKPKVSRVFFECENCGNTFDYQVQGTIKIPQGCSCDYPAIAEVEERWEYRDHQLLKLGSLPEENGGDSSDSLAVHCYDDLAGKVANGDIVRVNGMLLHDTDDLEKEKYPSTRRDWYLEAEAIDSENQTFDEFEAERINEIKEISERDDLYDALIDSFAPHILTDEYGDMQKLGMVLQQFGGVKRTLPNGKERKRDINILLVGDPGAGKSQYLSEGEAIAPKSVKASGKGATPAGLTATAEQSDLTNSWTLSAGALVLANNGLACIDEFDKMNDNTRKSMHEALEDQQVPINKAGINTTLATKCSVLAAANPEYGRYDRFEPLSEQIDLGPTMIQRFDLIFAMVDTPDEETDKRIVHHQLAFDSDKQQPEIEMDLLREYIAYARQRIKPSWDDGDKLRDLIAEYYADLRKRATGDDGYSDIGPRVTDSLRRLAEASARARLSDTVDVQDVKRACDLMDYHIGQVGLDEDGNITQAGGNKSVMEQKAEEQGERESRHETIVAYLRGNAMPISDISRDLGIEREQLKDDLDRLVQQERVDKLPNNRYEA